MCIDSYKPYRETAGNSVSIGNQIILTLLHCSIPMKGVKTNKRAQNL